MRILKRVVLFLLILAVVFSAYALISGKTFLFKAVAYNFANIDDYKKFSNNTVTISKPQPWQVSAGYNKAVLTDSLTSMLEVLGSVGLLMVKNDSIVYERYWDDYNDSSLSGSFSMAKSITRILQYLHNLELLLFPWQKVLPVYW